MAGRGGGGGCVVGGAFVLLSTSLEGIEGWVELPGC